MTNTLFIGSYLSKKTGTKDIAEKIAYPLSQEGIVIKLVSRKNNKLLRLLEIALNIIFSKQKTVHFDVFSGNAFFITEIGSLLGKLRNKHILFTLRGGALADFEGKYSGRVKKVFERANHLQTPSLFLKSYFADKGYNVSYLPNPVNLENFPFSSRTVTSHKILWIRAFTNIYNPELAILILVEVRKKYPDVTLTMIGPDKGLLGKVKGLIHRLQLEDAVDIVGPVQNDQLFSFFHDHAVYLNTTSYESFGTAILEAAACGVPIVSTNVGEIPYLWTDEEDILLVEDFNASSFATRIIQIFEDKEMARLISVNARKKAEMFSWENIKPLWLSLLS